MPRIGRYEILHHIASGGMGRVYLARASGPSGFERHVVIKTLEVEATDDDPWVAMFLDEARVVARMHHQHIAPVFDVGRDDDGRYFLVMDYVHGQTAKAVWERAAALGAALPIDFAVTVVAAGASALHYAHTRTSREGAMLGIVHRDVSLSNLMIGYDGAIRLIDFGIAKAADQSTLTRAGLVKGKVAYMAPEQVSGLSVDHRADIFALGIVLYELTTMTRAFREPTAVATAERIQRGDVIPPTRLLHGFPPDLERIIMRALAVDPAERFPTADVLRRELEVFGYRNRLVVGDAAVIEVMSQLFDQRDEPWLLPPDTTIDVSSPIEAAPEEIEDNATVPVSAADASAAARKLRAATEVVETRILDAAPRAIHDLPTQPVTDLGAWTTTRPPSATGTAQTEIATRRWWLPIAVGLTGIGVIVLLVGPWSTPSHRESTPTPAPPATLPSADARPSASDAPAAPAGGPRMVHVRISSTPTDATVLLDGERLGSTPYDGTLPAAPGAHVLKVRRRGHATERIAIDLSADVVLDVTLERE